MRIWCNIDSCSDERFNFNTLLDNNVVQISDIFGEQSLEKSQVAFSKFLFAFIGSTLFVARGQANSRLGFSLSFQGLPGLFLDILIISRVFIEIRNS